MKKRIAFTLVVILIPAVLFAIVGCMKAPENKVDYGPEVSPTAVDEALTSLGQPDPYRIKKGEFNYTEYTTQIDVNDAQLVKQVGETVIDKIDDPEYPGYWRFTIKTELNELDENGVWKPSYDEGEARLKKPVSSAMVQSLALRIARDSGVVRTQSNPKITFHNLKQQIDTVPIPPLVAKEPKCGGLPRCDRPLRVNKVSVDLVEWTSEEHGEKTTINYITSTDVPYHSFLLSHCAQSWIDYHGRTLPLTQCKQVRNFRFGTDQ